MTLKKKVAKKSQIRLSEDLSRLLLCNFSALCVHVKKAKKKELTMNKSLFYCLGVIFLALADAAIPQQNLERKSSKDKGRQEEIFIVMCESEIKKMSPPGREGKLPN